MKKLLLVGLLLLQIGIGNLSFVANNENKNLTKNTVNVVNTNSSTIVTTESGKIQGFVQEELMKLLAPGYNF